MSCPYNLINPRIDHVFREESDATRRMILHLQLHGRRAAGGVSQPGKTLEALEHLDDDTKQRFQDLRVRCLIEKEEQGEAAGSAGPGDARIGAGRTHVGDFTPDPLKCLVPPGVPGAMLCWQASRRHFQGYYRGARPQGSISSVYGGPRSPADPVVALQFVVEWLWRQHSAAGLGGEPPSAATIKRAWAEALERQGGACNALISPACLFPFWCFLLARVA